MVEKLEDIIARQKKEREEMRAKIAKNRKKLVDVPDPIILSSSHAVKGLKALEDGKTLLIGMENGEVKIAEKLTLSVILTQKLSEDAILKIEQV